MLSLQTIVATKVYPWRSSTWPIQSAWTGDSLTIQGSVSEHFEFQIRKQSELNTNLQNKTSSDVSAIRRGIRIRFISAKNNKTNATLTYSQVAKIFNEFVKDTADMTLTIENNTLDIFAPSTIIGHLRSQKDGVVTPLHPGTKLTFVTSGSTPFADASGISVDEAIEVDKKWEQKNVDVESGMIDFAKKFQALDARRDAVNKPKPQSDDDEWD